MSKPLILGISGPAGSGKSTVASMFPVFVPIALGDPLKRLCRSVYDFTVEQLWGPSEERSKPDLRYPRAHTWVRPQHTSDLRPGDFVRGDESTCACCGQVARLYQNEDDVWRESEEDITPCYLTPRFALQTLGTEWGRGCYEATWVETCLRASRLLTESPGWTYTATIGLEQTVSWNLTGPAPAQGVFIHDVRFRDEVQQIQARGGKVIRLVRPKAGLGGAAGQHQSEKEMGGIFDHEFDAVLRNDESLDVLRERAEALIERLRG
jgi:hypothetical protein